MTMNEITKILKPAGHFNYFRLCANYLNEIKEAEANGAEDYEIRGLATRTGVPFVISFDR